MAWEARGASPCRRRTSLSGRYRELARTLGVQRSEDARNLTSLRARRRSPGDLEQPPGNRRRKISAVPICGTTERLTLAEKIVEVCDVARAQKSFGTKASRVSWIIKRMPGGRRCGTTHA